MELRPEVQRFAEEMERRLRDKDNKKGESWKGATDLQLLDKFDEEVRELRECFLPSGPKITGKILHETADVGNLAMMIADRFGELMRDKRLWR